MRFKLDLVTNQIVLCVSESIVDKVVFADFRQPLFAEFGLKSFDDFFGYCGGERTSKNNKRDVVEFHLGEESQKKHFFMKRFYNPHFKDMLFARRNFGRFCSQAVCEWENANLLLKNDIGTYRPVCYGEQLTWGIERKSFFVIEELQGRCFTDFVARNWSQLAQSQKEKIIVSLAKLIRRIHDLNINLPDLYLWHIFIKETEIAGEWEFAVIDLHRMSHNVTDRNQQIKNLGRLDHSMRDEYFDDSIRRLFIESYAGGNWPGGIAKLATKVKRYSNAMSAKRSPKPY